VIKIVLREAGAPRRARMAALREPVVADAAAVPLPDSPVDVGEGARSP
jgi:hypothetical protein